MIKKEKKEKEKKQKEQEQEKKEQEQEKKIKSFVNDNLCLFDYFISYYHEKYPNITKDQIKNSVRIKINTANEYEINNVLFEKAYSEYISDIQINGPRTGTDSAVYNYDHTKLLISDYKNKYFQNQDDKEFIKKEIFKDHVELENDYFFNLIFDHIY